MRMLVAACLLVVGCASPDGAFSPEEEGSSEIPVTNDLLSATTAPFSLLVADQDAGSRLVSVDRVLQRGETWTLTSSQAPGSSVTLSVSMAGLVSRYEVSAHSATVLGLDVLFDVPADFDCHLGFSDWAFEQHSCGGSRGTLASFCLTSACDNALVRPEDPSTGPARIGARLRPTPVTGLDGTAFVLFQGAAPWGTPASARELAAFFASVRPSRTTSPGWLINAPPALTKDPAELSWTEAAAARAASIAQQLHVGEVMLIDRQWSRSLGAWDPRVPFDTLAAPFRKAGICPLAHTLVSLVDDANPMCDRGILPRPGTCASGAWLLDETGAPVHPPFGAPGTFLWDTRSADWVNFVADSWAQGLREGQACGLYADAADWFATPGAPMDWAASFRARSPGTRMRMSIGNSALALFVDELEITDQWQVQFSNTPADWAFNWGYPLLRGEWQHLGMSPRLGWIPPATLTDTPGTYLPLLNAAVATGSFLNVQMSADDPALSEPRLAWFRQALALANDAVTEIRSGDALAVTGESDARHDVLHFSNGVSTVALFDQLVPSADGAGLEARRHGVEVQRGAACGPFTSCFRFNGALRYPPSWTQPKLDDPGSFLEVPASEATRLASVTMSLWFKSEELRGGVLLEKGPMGFGLYAYVAGQELRVGGHLTGTPGAFLLNDYATVSPGQWHHLVYSYDDVTHRVVSAVDGHTFLDVVASGRGPARPSANSTVWIGSTPGGAPFKGWMNDVRLYDRALSDAELLTLSQPGAPLVTAGLVTVLEANTPRVPAGRVVEIDLGTQHTAWVVPLVHDGSALTDETVRLVFRPLSRKWPQLTACAAALAPVRRLDGAVQVDVRATLLGASACRVHLE